MKAVSKTAAMKNAEASVRMEGYHVTHQMRKACESVLSGKATTADCLKQLLKQREAM